MTSLPLIIGILRAIVEVAGMALLGQGALAVLAGAARQGNPVYRLFQVITGPAVRAVRFLTPRFIVDAHIPWLTFCLLFWLWLALAFLRQVLCLSGGTGCPA